MQIEAENWLVTLQKNGYRLTLARKAVIDLLQENMCALTPVEVYNMARKEYPRLGLVSVYRTLEKLEGLGLVQRVHQTKGCQAFVRTGSGHQHILICQKCGKAVLFGGDQLDSLFTSIAKSTGFQIQSHWLQIFGLCNACQSD